MKLLQQEAKSSPADHQTAQETAPTDSCLTKDINHLEYTVFTINFARKKVINTQM
jgi:hypothetical protein